MSVPADTIAQDHARRRQLVLHLAILAAAVVALYLNTLRVPFVFDDSQIFTNQTGDFCSLSREGLLRAARSTAQPNRVLPNLTFTLNTCLHGSAVAGYHWLNILVHLATALSFYFLARLILSILFQREKSALIGLEVEIAFAAALLWAVHPVQTNAVTYIIQRMTAMAALFSLLAVFCYLKARLREGTRSRVGFGLLALLFSGMALASKENAGILPLTLLGCEVFIVQADLSVWQRNRQKILGPLLLAGAIFLLIALAMLGASPWENILAGYQTRDFTLGQRLLTEARIIWHYLSLIVLPLPARLNIAYDYPLSHGLLAPPQTLFALLGLAVLLWSMVFLYPRQRLTAFAIFWFLLNLLIESSIIPLMLIFEHRLYLPSTMVLLAAVFWCYRCGRNLALVRGCGIAVLVLFSFFTWQRNTVWQSELTLWTDAASKSPQLSWAYVNLGKVYAQQRQYGAAEKNFQQALALEPESGLALLNLGVLYEQQNRLAEAREMLARALTKKVANHGLLLSNLALVELKLGRSAAAAAYAEQAISKAPGLYKPHDILAVAALKGGDTQRAQEVLEKALTLFPGRGEAYARLASVYEKQDRLAESQALLEGALRQRVTNQAQVYNQLAIVHWRLKRYPESIRAAQQAIREDPNLLDAYLTLGITYEDSGQQVPAFTQFTAAWQRGLDMAGIYANWAAGHLQSGNPDRAILYLREAARLEPDRAKTHQLLAEAYGRKGMNAEATQEKELARRLLQGNNGAEGR
ncbi:MAG: tetratricopeptide repeat protein [Desulfobulbaceae bacterium]